MASDTLLPQQQREKRGREAFLAGLPGPDFTGSDFLPDRETVLCDTWKGFYDARSEAGWYSARENTDEGERGTFSVSRYQDDEQGVLRQDTIADLLNEHEADRLVLLLDEAARIIFTGQSRGESESEGN